MLINRDHHMIHRIFVEINTFLINESKIIKLLLLPTGKRYVYRFVCDLKSLLNLSPEELHRMVDLKMEQKDEDCLSSNQSVLVNGSHNLLL